MKNTYKLLFTLIIVITTVCNYTACKKDSENEGPKIRYIRVTDPVKSDSMLTSARQGDLIDIVGENLQDAQQVWFNDLKANLTPTYITDKAILVTVPASAPSVVDNKLKIVFPGGDTLKYAFKVLINAPTLQSMKCEFVPAGSVATIYGNYFYEPMTIAFTGGVTGELVSINSTNQAIDVTVPDGAQPGPVTITTNFGTTSSSFWFDDNRNVFINYDPFAGWWGSSFVVSNPGPTDPVAISGNYVRVKQLIASWAWVGVGGGPIGSEGGLDKAIPDDAILHPSNYNLKFEVNTVKPYNAGGFKIEIGRVAFDDHIYYYWNPPLDTKGEWQTVVIPFEEVTSAYIALGASVVTNPSGYANRVMFSASTALDCDMSFDNFRVVPK
jgi:hypothetical protein